MKYLKSFKAFTLAEAIVVLAILGIVAAITIPATINRHQESANRAKLKKALANYETVMNSIVVENVLKSDANVTGYANAVANCENTRKYFKQIKKQYYYFGSSYALRTIV